MLGVGWGYLSARYLLEWMPLHRARRAGNVGGRSRVVYAERCALSGGWGETKWGNIV